MYASTYFYINYLKQNYLKEIVYVDFMFYALTNNSWEYPLSSTLMNTASLQAFFGNPISRCQTLCKWLRCLFIISKQAWLSGSPIIPQSLSVTEYGWYTSHSTPKLLLPRTRLLLVFPEPDPYIINQLFWLCHYLDLGLFWLFIPFLPQTLLFWSS